jgi:hypothetical protein
MCLVSSESYYLPQGRHAAGTPWKNRVPLTPLGPSEVRSAGIPRRGTPAKCQKSVPDIRDIFSEVVSCERMSSTSKSWWPAAIVNVSLYRIVEADAGKAHGRCECERNVLITKLETPLLRSKVEVRLCIVCSCRINDYVDAYIGINGASIPCQFKRI